MFAVTLLAAVAAQCPFGGVGTPPPGHPDLETHASSADKAEYQKYLKGLNIRKLYDDIVKVMTTSQECWPADGPQDGDTASYAGFFGRLAWHCAGTLRVVDGKSYGGCEGGNIRFWPEREWRDNGNLDQAREILAVVKDMPEYRQLSWGDLITFAGTVGIKASGGPANKFCFGRVDGQDGSASIELGVEGVKDCVGDKCQTHALCEEYFHWDEQDTSDDRRCKLNQSNGRLQASHSVGLIYVWPHGPQLKKDHPEYDASLAHQRSSRLSAEEVRDTFKTRMGWTDRETVALVGGGHTLGRAHGNCANLKGDGSCTGKYTTTAGYEGAWTRTPSKWNYDYFAGLFESEWVPSKSPEGNDQWEAKDTSSPHAKTFRLTADLAMIADPKYKEWAQKYHEDHALFDGDFADAWFKLMHRSGAHPQDDDLEKDANTCTSFDFVQRKAEL